MDNPSPVRVHGLPKTPVVMLLCFSTHVESLTGAVKNGTWCISSSESIKLSVEEMTAKYEELKYTEQLIIYQSGSYDCPQKIICMDGTHYVLETLYSIWSRDVWRPQITNATMNSDNVGMAVFSAAINSVLLTARCKIPLYFEFTKYLKDQKVDRHQNRFVDDRILNIDQSKAYTLAFDPCMNDLLGTPGKCIGKIQESFLLSSHGEMIGMLEQKGIEGILIIYKESVDFDSVSIEKIKQHVLLINSNINVSYITVEKQYKMWRGIAAMVSYDSIEVKWDESSHVKENGIRHFAKAVGAECFQITGTIEKVYDFAELLRDDPENLDTTRVKIRMIGSSCIEIEHPVNGVNTTAHVSGARTDGVYCIREEGLDYESLLMPHFLIKDCGYIPNSPCGPSICGLRVKVDALSTNPQTLTFETTDELKTLFKLRSYKLLGPLEAVSGKPTIMTGAAGSGKTTLLAMEVT
ncbi:hypothetical protein T492DRAFT_842920 [Pavlovales sp. CCMP2436]|nr:hypothetical protein T492DRAFT_842920 [Pavlovales sp. CCMP2436]